MLPELVVAGAVDPPWVVVAAGFVVVAAGLVVVEAGTVVVAAGLVVVAAGKVVVAAGFVVVATGFVVVAAGLVVVAVGGGVVGAAVELGLPFAHVVHSTMPSVEELHDRVSTLKFGSVPWRQKRDS